MNSLYKENGSYRTCHNCYCFLVVIGFLDEKLERALTAIQFKKFEKLDEITGLFDVQKHVLSSRTYVDHDDLRCHIDWIIERFSGVALELNELFNMGRIRLICRWKSVGQGGPIISLHQQLFFVKNNIDVVLKLSCEIDKKYSGLNRFNYECFVQMFIPNQKNDHILSSFQKNNSFPDGISLRIKDSKYNPGYCISVSANNRDLVDDCAIFFPKVF